jgi:hypothetical protein
MAQLINRNEQIVAPFFKNGVTLQFFTIKFAGTDLTAKLTTDYAAFVAGTKTEETAKSPVVKALELIQSRVSIEIIGTPLYNTAGYSSATTLTIGVAAIGGNYPTDNYDGASGNETMAAYLQVLVRAASSTNSVSYQGVDLNSCTVTAFTI